MELPDKLSDLIIVALDELEVIEQHPNYRVNMNLAHLPKRGTGYCEVCFAGCLIAKDLDYNYKVAKGMDYDQSSSKLRMLDFIRDYNVTNALYLLDPNISLRKIVTLTQLNFDHPESRYKENAKIFKQNMRKIAQHLSNFNY